MAKIPAPNNKISGGSEIGKTQLNTLMHYDVNHSTPN